ncbi:hypothetical protein [Brenneria izbisi]|uniref:Uncharacterized protein n=1 Tax=Brenneria izbisi TaxID=2939450 RepID=A0AA41XXL0_9GAMM|nr:hypothetical protein [Brenneria izbisi]MCV9879208.1 hypothetical protein [Brenneria izbisi]MCV9882758.1 hypothetical protein [Brenneria izbisi]
MEKALILVNTIEKMCQTTLTVQDAQMTRRADSTPLFPIAPAVIDRRED